MASTTARCLLDGSRSASPPARWWSVRYFNGFARFSTSPSRSARSTNKQWQRKYEIGRARGPWDRPTRQGRVDNFSRRVLPPDTREFFTYERRNFACVQHFWTLPEITFVNMRFRSRPVYLCEGDF